MARFRSGLLLLPLAAIMALLLIESAAAAAAVRQGLALCARSVIPSLFPFFVAVSFAVNAGLFHTLRTWGVPTGAAVFALGALGGYPLGARTAGEAYSAGLLTKDEAQRLLSCCNNAGPAFILTVAGQTVFGSTQAGVFLWGIHLAVALGLYCLFCRGTKPRSAPAAPPDSAPMTAFIAAVKSAAETMLHLCAFVVLFTVVMALLGDPPPLVAGCLELTVGVTALTYGPAGFTMAAAFLGWGGLSVHCQTAAVLSGSGLSLRRYFAGKALHGLLSAALAWCLFPLL